MKQWFPAMVVYYFLAWPAFARANMAVRVYQDDPDYRQMALTHLVIAFALSLTAMLGFLLVRSTGFKRLVGAGCFLFGLFGLFMYLLVHTNLHWHAGTRPPGAGPGNFLTDTGPIHGPISQLPPPVVGIILALVATVAWWWLSRYFRAKQLPASSVGAAGVAASSAPSPSTADQL